MLGIATRTVFSLVFLLRWLFDDFEGGTVVDIVKVLEDQVLVKFLADYNSELRLEFFVFDKLVEETEAAWHCKKFSLFRKLSEDKTRKVKDDSNTIVIVLVKVEQV